MSMRESNLRKGALMASQNGNDRTPRLLERGWVRVLLSLAIVFALALAWSPANAGVVATAVAVYMLPTYVAALRERHRMAPVALVNALVGWTVVGWFVALVWATTGDTRADRAALSQRA